MIPAGIFDSGSVQVNGNLNGWVRTDMKKCWTNPEPIQIVNDKQMYYIELADNPYFQWVEEKKSGQNNQSDWFRIL